MCLKNIVEAEEVEQVLLSHLKANNLFQEDPRPWTIRTSPLGGRGMFATRDIQRNELIFVDAPLIIGPRCIGKHLRLCVCCYKSDCALFPCDRGCGLPVCSRECENLPQHVNYECQYLRSLVPTCGSDWSLDLLLAVAPIRAIFMTDQQRQCLAALQCDQTLTPTYEIELLKKNVLNSPCEKDLELMKRVCGAFNTNSFETVSVHDKNHYTSLRALYPMGSLQNHCCVPNTGHHFDEMNRLYVNAALPISAGEEITMTYTSIFWDTTLRRQFLSSTKHFSCMCKRCSDPMEFGSRLGALFCASDECAGQLLPQNSLNMATPWICDKCGKTISHRQICSIRSGVAAVVEEVVYKKPRQIFNFMQRELSVLVPWSNYLIVDVMFRVISYYGRSEGLAWEDLTETELEIKAKFCKDLLFILDVLHCGNCKKRGLILYELYCTNLENMKRLGQLNREKADENQRLLEEALAIIQNDIVSAVTIENDQKYFNQSIKIKNKV